MCHTLLAPDRLAPEFPASEEAAVTSCLTVQDVLRETASSASIGSQTPLDEQVKRFRKSLWEHEHESHPGLHLGTRRLAANSTPALYIVLGIASLLAILALVVGVFFHTIWQDPGERRADSLAQPTASRSEPSPAVKSARYDSLDAIPVTVETSPEVASASVGIPSFLPGAVGGWKLLKNSVWPLSRLSTGRILPGRVALADYQNGQRIAEISLLRTRAGQGHSARRLIAVAGGPRTVPRIGGSRHISPRLAVWHGVRCLIFDYHSPIAGADQLILTDNPYLPHFPHTISWYTPPYVVTVGADSASARNSFAASFLAEHR